MLGMGFIYFTFKEVPAVKGALHGASAAAVALTITMVIKTGKKCLSGPVPIACSAAAFILNGLLRWPLLISLAILARLSLIWAWPPTGRSSRHDDLPWHWSACFGMLSLLFIGGGNMVLPEMHLQAVSGHHWLTNGEFADIFSISQAAGAEHR